MQLKGDLYLGGAELCLYYPYVHVRSDSWLKACAL